MTKKRMVKYSLIETKAYVEDSGMVAVYGISCREEKEDGGGAEYQEVPNISTKAAFVEELIDKLSNHDGDPIHLKDFIYDYLP